LPSVDVVRLYEIYRSYVIHEDTLIHERSQRMLIIQGALLTAAGALQAKLLELFDKVQPFDPVKRELPPELLPIAVLALSSLLIAVSGYLAARSLRASLGAARDATRALVDRWGEVHAGHVGAAALPKLVGGGHEDAHERGLRYIDHLPNFFMYVWIGFFLIVFLILASTAVRLTGTSTVFTRFLMPVLSWVRWYVYAS